MAESDAELTEIPASEILEKIQKGKAVEYDHVRIIDDFDVYKLDLPTKHVDRTDLKKIPGISISEECKVVSSSIKITISTFNSQAIFDNIFFEDSINYSINFDNTTFSGHASFRGATFGACPVFSGATFNRGVFFDGATFNGGADFKGATFDEGTLFTGVAFSTGANFSDATFCGYTHFDDATFGGSADFSRAFFGAVADFSGNTFSMDAGFSGALFRGDADFWCASFGMDANFSCATISGDASFKRTTFSMNANFSKAAFMDSDFSGAKFVGDVLTFRDAVFSKPKSQEEACRRAKNVLAKAGNRDDEEYHFYHEMEAKRIQKGIRGNSGLGLVYLLLKTETWSFWRFISYDVLEWFFVQKIFGYGVHPVWLFGWWLCFVVVFAAIYLFNGGIEQPDARQWYDYFWFSVATAATPGYALYKPVGTFKFMAGMEAILGTFMWAAFITTFARKFMR